LSVRPPKLDFAHFVATSAGVGLLGLAPGTWGSIAAFPVAALLEKLPPPVHLAVIGILAGAGAVAAESVARQRGDHDPQFVVIDETVGTLLSLYFVRGRGLGARLEALVWFRFLDIVKPGLIRPLGDVKPDGLGIMLDDVAAGILAGLMAGPLSRRTPCRACRAA
jgi:phosphatidylglycerophosphatase A